MIFQRLHGRGSGAGTGIGRAIVNRIRDRCGGRIGVESEPWREIDFYFTLRHNPPMDLCEKENGAGLACKPRRSHDLIGASPRL